MDVVNFITTVGFPIAAFLIIYYDLRLLIKENTKVVRFLAYKMGYNYDE